MKNIILVEDDSAVLEMLCTYVKSKGDQPYPFKNGKEVLDFINSNKNIKFNLLITDYEMEPVNGIQLIEILNKQACVFPKILLTSHNETHLMVRAIESQIFRFIEKPLKYTTLDPIYNDAINKDNTIEKDNNLKKLGEMYNTIAHEIANPLNSILLFIELIKQTYANENKLDLAKLMSQLDTIQNSGLRIDSIVKDTKEFINSKPMKIEEFRFSTILEEIQVGYKAIKNSEKIKLDLNDCQDILISFDRGQLYRLMVNLMSNAVDAVSDKKNKWIKIEASQDKESSCIRVIDCGEGINEDIVSQLFNGYSQKKTCRGTGLGLDICRKILHEYNGTLKYELHKGNTSFVICLPKE